MLVKIFGLLLAATASVSAQTAKAVYAHFMVGIVENYTVGDWKVDIQQAKEIGIDGFALNCAPPRVDSYTTRQLAYAYQAAQELGGFKMFISFDFAYWGDGDTSTIAGILNTYATHPAAAYYDGGALVSTFIGDYFNWNTVKSQVGGRKFTVLPMLQDPFYITYQTTGIDGAFSWYAWASGGGNSPIPGPMTTAWDQKFISYTDQVNKPYMAPVSPWFFTHFPSKNWIFTSGEQPARRWEQILNLKPELVEIISWNDFGESHYISGSQPKHSDDGSSKWATGFPHDAWRDLMKPYIAAYKSGANAPTVDTEKLIYWYRPHLKDLECSGDNVAPPRGREYETDVVFVSTMLNAAAQLTVTSGNQGAVTVNIPAGIQTRNFTMAAGQQRFAVSRGGQQIFGGTSPKDVSSSCVTYNFNAYVGSF